MGSSRVSIERRVAPIRQQVYEILRVEIVEGRLKPGQRLVERELCSFLGASRTVVRETLRVLETRGLVRMLPSGPIVAPVCEKDVKDLYDVRERLEGLAVRLFATQVDERWRAELEGCVTDMRMAIARDDAEAFIKAKDRFYTALAQGCGNEVLRDALEIIHDRAMQLRGSSLSTAERRAESLAEIERILEVIQMSDPKLAEEACSIHVRKARTAVLQQLSASHRG